MSAPALFEKEADILNFGFLSIRAANSLRAMLASEEIGAEERQVLRRASEFLKKVSSGAELVASGQVDRFHDPLQSIQALQFATRPARSVQKEVDANNFGPFFTEIAQAVRRWADETPPPLNDKESIDWAANFFDALYQALAESLDTSRQILGSNPDSRPLFA